MCSQLNCLSWATTLYILVFIPFYIPWCHKSQWFSCMASQPACSKLQQQHLRLSCSSYSISTRSFLGQQDHCLSSQFQNSPITPHQVTTGQFLCLLSWARYLRNMSAYLLWMSYTWAAILLFTSGGSILVNQQVLFLPLQMMTGWKAWNSVNQSVLSSLMFKKIILAFLTRWKLT